MLAFCKLVLKYIVKLYEQSLQKANSSQPEEMNPVLNPGNSEGQEDSQRTFALLFTNTHLTVISDPETVSDRTHHIFGIAGLIREKKRKCFPLNVICMGALLGHCL